MLSKMDLKNNITSEVVSVDFPSAQQLLDRIKNMEIRIAYHVAEELKIKLTASVDFEPILDLDKVNARLNNDPIMEGRSFRYTENVRAAVPVALQCCLRDEILQYFLSPHGYTVKDHKMDKKEKTLLISLEPALPPIYVSPKKQVSSRFFRRFLRRSV